MFRAAHTVARLQIENRTFSPTEVSPWVTLWVTDAHAGVVFGVPTHTPAHTRRQAQTHTRARAYAPVCVCVCNARTPARQALTHHTRTQVRAHQTHMNHGACVRTRSGFPRCHDCRSPEVSSEPSNPRKRNRRQGDGSQTLNGYRLRLTLARSDRKAIGPYMLALGPRPDIYRQAFQRPLNGRRRQRDQGLLQHSTT